MKGSKKIVIKILTFPDQYATISLDTRAHLNVSTKFCPAIQTDFARRYLQGWIAIFCNQYNNKCV